MPDQNSAEIIGLDEKLDVDAINALQQRKLAARERLRAARQEMIALDLELAKAGAPGHVIRALCW